MEHYKISPSHNIDTSDFFLYLMANSDSAAMFFLDDKGIVLDINLGVTRSYGYAKEDVVGQYFSFLFIEEDRNKNLPEIEIKTALEKGVARDNNYVLHKNGTQIWSQGESVFVKNKEGKIYIIKNIYDLNNQKMLEGFLINSNKKLLSIVNDRDNFVYAVSHDLKTPINNLKGLIEALMKQMPHDIKGDTVVKLKEMIINTLERLQLRLQELSKIGMLSEEEEPEEVHLDILWKEVKEDLDNLLSAWIVTLHVDFSKVNTVSFSKKHLRSILYNLVSNAIKYKSPERLPVVKIKTELVEGYTLLTVEDNGTGIDEKDFEKIFLLGKRLNDKVEGTGIGLTLIKRIVDNIDSKIEVESKPGKGSTFKVYLKN